MRFSDYYYFARTESPGGDYSNPTSGSFSDAVDNLSPTAYWRLGEASGDFADESGTGHTMTAGGSPTYGATGWASDDDAITTDGTSDYGTVGDHADWDFGTGDFSIMWCQKLASWPGSDAQVIGHDGQGYPGEWRVLLSSAAGGRVFLKLDTTNYYVDASALNDTDYHFVVLTADRDGNMTVYVDGSATSYTVSISADSSTDLTNARDLWMCARDATPSGDLGLAVTIDEVAIWKGTLLTGTQVQTLYEAQAGTPGGGGDPGTYATEVLSHSPVAYYPMDEGTGETVMVDASTSGNDGSYNGTPTLGVSGPFASASGVEFDGTNWAQAPYDAALDVGTSDYSLVAWVKVADGASWPSGWLIGRSGDGDVDDYELALHLEDQLRTRVGSETQHYSSDTTAWGTDWHMVAACFDRSGNVTFYIDGATYGTSVISADSAADLSGSKTLYIARRNSTGFLTGSMCQVAIFDSLLSDTDISDIYDASGL